MFASESDLEPAPTVCGRLVCCGFAYEALYRFGVSLDRSHLFKLNTADTNYIFITCVALPRDAVPSQPDPRPASTGCFLWTCSTSLLGVCAAFRFDLNLR